MSWFVKCLFCLLLIVFGPGAESPFSIHAVSMSVTGVNATPVQLSFCLITGTANTNGGYQTTDSYTTVSYGIFNTSAATLSLVALISLLALSMIHVWIICSNSCACQLGWSRSVLWLQIVVHQ